MQIEVLMSQADEQIGLTIGGAFLITRGVMFTVRTSEDIKTKYAFLRYCAASQQHTKSSDYFRHRDLLRPSVAIPTSWNNDLITAKFVCIVAYVHKTIRYVPYIWLFMLLYV